MIGALVKVDDADVINFLLSTEIIPLCLRIMETGSELSKTVATFIVQKILLDETGLAYIATAERFYAVSTVLANLVGTLVELGAAAQAHCPMLPPLVRQRTRQKLCASTSRTRYATTFGACLKDDVTTKRWLTQLLFSISTGSRCARTGRGRDSDAGEGVLGGRRERTAEDIRMRCTYLRTDGVTWAFRCARR